MALNKQISFCRACTVTISDDVRAGKELKSTARDVVECGNFSFFSRYDVFRDLLQYIYAQQNEIYLFHTSKVL